MKIAKFDPPLAGVGIRQIKAVFSDHWVRFLV